MAAAQYPAWMLRKVTAYSSIESLRVGRRLLRRCAPRNDRKGCAPLAMTEKATLLAMAHSSVIASPEGAWRSPCTEIASAAARPRNDGKGLPPRNDGKGLPPRNDGREGTLAFRRTSKPVSHEGGIIDGRSTGAGAHCSSSRGPQGRDDLRNLAIGLIGTGPAAPDSRSTQIRRRTGPRFHRGAGYARPAEDQHRHHGTAHALSRRHIDHQRLEGELHSRAGPLVERVGRRPHLDVPAAQ